MSVGTGADGAGTADGAAGPPVEALTRRLIDTPRDLLAEPVGAPDGHPACIDQGFRTKGVWLNRKMVGSRKSLTMVLTVLTLLTHPEPAFALMNMREGGFSKTWRDIDASHAAA